MPMWGEGEGEYAFMCLFPSLSNPKSIPFFMEKKNKIKRRK